MDTKEFTEPFDLERWVAGEPAYCDRLKKVREFGRRGRNDWLFTKCKEIEVREDLIVYGVSEANTWRMKPIEPSENPWIPHDGGCCPIPWAQKEDFGFETERVRHNVSHNQAVSLDWSKVIAWRLTNGWRPVLGGKCPKEIEGATAGEWEYRFRDGDIRIAKEGPARDGRYFWECDNKGYDVVAVRLIKPAEKDRCTCGPSDPYICDACRKTRKTALEEDQMPVYVGIDWGKDVAAYHRFRSSPRGISALAQIGKAAGPQFRPLGEDEMLSLFSAALSEFEAEIERNRNG